MEREGEARFFEGLRFGALLQLAVGPVCLYVLRTGATRGIVAALAAALGVVLADALYIFLALTSVARLAERARLRRPLQLLGAAVVALFAVDILASALGRPLLPALSLARPDGGPSTAFVGGLVLTLSSPLTILFWAGVFAAKVAAQKLDRPSIVHFSLGCLAASALFLPAVAAAGAVAGRYLPPRAIAALNGCVGVALLVLSVRLAMGGSRSVDEPPSRPSRA